MPKIERGFRHATRAALSSLVQEAGALQTASHNFALLSLATSILASGTISSHHHIRQALQDFLAARSRLRNCDSDLLSECDPELSGIMTRAFTREVEDIYRCFESMARDLCNLFARGLSPTKAELSELVGFVSHQLQEANKSIASAAKLVADTARTDAEKLAVTDLLTGLPNRRALQDILHQLSVAGSPAHSVAIMHIDLDNFKKINDSLGHAAGDAALKHAARAMVSHMNELDFMARSGGDEFAVVLFGQHDEAALADRAKALIDSISVPFLHDDKKICVAASIGIATSSNSKDVTLDRCMINADLALYTAKHAGRGTYHFFTPYLQTQSQQKEDLHAQILQGLETQQFEPFFQPQVEGRTGKLVGLEALVRWHHPTRGLLVPFHFLDAAHEANVLNRLDEFVMERTFMSFKGWIKLGLDVPQVSINLTGSRLLEVDLVDSLLRAVDQVGLEPSRIGIEILESAMIDDSSRQMLENTQKLVKAGFKLELDDFGTGHASISNLRNFKVDRIKIDRSFVKDIHLYPELSKITGAMIGLAHSLRVDALAEGVETAEERLVLNALGCDHFQGYGVSKPMPGADFPDWFKRTQSKKLLPPRRD